jgi:glyoxylase-like metal-dependent hydrolase (beta-lactamase superfamily II)
LAAEKIFEGIWMVGGPDLTDGADCCVYLISFGGELVLIDSGAGESVGQILENVKALKLDPERIKKLVLTHCHIDHIGGANEFKSKLGVEIIAHEKGAEILLRGDPVLTAAKWYGMDAPVIAVDRSFPGDELKLDFGEESLRLIYIPGHSPDSIVVYLDRAGKRILFGQDIHGPLHAALGSDAKLYRQSLQKLMGLGADILCEGHFGIYQPKAAVQRYIEAYLNRIPETETK